MQFIRSASESEGATALYERLKRELEDGHKVLWLTSGGSNIPLSVLVMKQLEPALTANLGIMTADERYGPVGHPDSNWQQLMTAGFPAKKAKLIPLLQADLSLGATAERFEDLAHTTFHDYDTVIGQFGLGTDGHIIGILPNTQAAHENKRLTIAYKGPTYEDRPAFERLTLTPVAVSHVSEIYLFAYGEAKRPVLEKLKSENLNPVEQPVHLLKDRSGVYIFNEQVGD